MEVILQVVLAKFSYLENYTLNSSEIRIWDDKVENIEKDGN